MEGRAFPDGTGVNAIVEEQDQRAPPESSDGKRLVPALRSLHAVRREIQGVDLLLGQVMSARDGAVLARCWESRESLQEILFPGPGHDGSEMFASLIRRATGIRSTLRDRTLVDPVKAAIDLPGSTRTEALGIPERAPRRLRADRGFDVSLPI
jgi:hypothetical protein